MDLRICVAVFMVLFSLSQGAPQKPLNSIQSTDEKEPIKILKQINKANPDGSYSYGFEAEDGTFKVETRFKNGLVKGRYGYIDTNGALKVVEYTAGEKSDGQSDDEGQDQTIAAQTPAKKVTSGSEKEREELSSNEDDSDDGKNDEGRNGVEDFGSFGSPQQGQPQFVNQGGNPYAVNGGNGGFTPSPYAGPGQGAGPQYISSQGQFQGQPQFSQYPINQIQGRPQQFTVSQGARQFDGAGLSSQGQGQSFDGQFNGPTSTGFPIVSQGGRSQFGGPRALSNGQNNIQSLRGVNNGDGTYTPNVELDGFSEDADEDGYVDTFPRSQQQDGQRSAQAQGEAPVVQTTQGVRLGGPGTGSGQQSGGVSGIEGLRAGQVSSQGPNGLRIQNNQGQFQSVPGNSLTPGQLQAIYAQGGIPVGPGGVPLQGFNGGPGGINGINGQFGGPGQFNPQFNPNAQFGQGFQGGQSFQGQGPQGFQGGQFNPNGQQFSSSPFGSPQQFNNAGPQFTQLPIQSGQAGQAGSPGSSSGLSGAGPSPSGQSGQGGQSGFVQLPGGVFNPSGQQVQSQPNQFTSQPGSAQGQGQSPFGLGGSPQEQPQFVNQGQIQGQSPFGLGGSPQGQPQFVNQGGSPFISSGPGQFSGGQFNPNGQQFTPAQVQNFLPGQQGQISPQFLQNGQGGQFFPGQGGQGQFSGGVGSPNFPFDYGQFGGPFQGQSFQGQGPQGFQGQGFQGQGAQGFQGQGPQGFQGQGIQGQGGQGQTLSQGSGSANGLRAILLNGEQRGVISGSAINDESSKGSESAADKKP